VVESGDLMMIMTMMMIVVVMMMTYPLQIDVSLFVGGVHGDNCATVCVGNVDEKGRALVDATKKALDAAVAVCRPGGNLAEVRRGSRL
jgi:Xaa-Pro aminopeptidase